MSGNCRSGQSQPDQTKTGEQASGRNGQRTAMVHNSAIEPRDRCLGGPVRARLDPARTDGGIHHFPLEDLLCLFRARRSISHALNHPKSALMSLIDLNFQGHRSGAVRRRIGLDPRAQPIVVLFDVQRGRD